MALVSTLIGSNGSIPVQNQTQRAVGVVRGRRCRYVHVVVDDLVPSAAARARFGTKQRPFVVFVARLDGGGECGASSPIEKSNQLRAIVQSTGGVTAPPFPSFE